MTRLQTKWTTRWVGEFVVIVLGVLVAFGVDDWRQYRADRELEAHLLERLEEDLKADAADLALARTTVVRRQWLLGALLTDVEDGVGDARPYEPPPDSLVDPTETRALLLAVGRLGGSIFESWDPLKAPLGAFAVFAEFDLSDDSFQEMLGSGAFRTLRDRSLRSGILAYYRTAADMGENERRQALYQPRLEDALSEVGITLGDSVSFARLASRVAADARLAVEIRRSLNDMRLQLLFLGFLDGARFRLESSLAASRTAAS